MGEFLHDELSGRDAPIHKVLLDAYRTTQTDNGWHSAPDDGYLYNHLGYHLNAAGAYDELGALFANQQWMKVRVPNVDTSMTVMPTI